LFKKTNFAEVIMSEVNSTSYTIIYDVYLYDFRTNMLRNHEHDVTIIVGK
jgi:hypothetical protein